MDLQKFLTPENEKPLDRIVTSDGFAGIFRTIGCIGDSLSSGEFETNMYGAHQYHDYYEYSWGQYLGRMIGAKVYNFSKGGMTAENYVNSFAESQRFWNPSLACQAYIIALGVNDLLNSNTPLGTMDDICAEDYTKNGKTFTGYYAYIIQRLKTIQPRACFFLMTIPSGGRPPEKEIIQKKHQERLYEMADYFTNTYVLDFLAYGPAYDEEFRKQFFLSGHMNPCGYILTAQMVSSYIDYLVRHNIKAFREVPFIGTSWHYLDPEDN